MDPKESARSAYSKLHISKHKKNSHKNNDKHHESGRKRKSEFDRQDVTLLPTRTVDKLKIPRVDKGIKSVDEGIKSVDESITSVDEGIKSVDEGIEIDTPPVHFYNRPQLTFEWLINPLTISEFFENWWQQNPITVAKRGFDYYNNILTSKSLDTIMRSNLLHYSKDVNVFSYEDGRLANRNLKGRVYPSVLWKYFSESNCVIQLSSPQTYSKQLHTLVSVLQEYFGCAVGIEAYLTSTGTHGSTPHFDDADIFVLQLDGLIHWKIYAARSDDDVLPVHSNKCFDASSLKEPVRDLLLPAGGLLYLPRGTIYETYTENESHSIYIAISVYRKSAYCDLLQHVLKSTLNTAVRKNVAYRRGLPIQYLKYTGLIHSSEPNSVRDEIVSTAKELITKLTDYITVDAAADELGKQFMWDAMPPIYSANETSCMVYENSERLVNGEVCNEAIITLNISVRLSSYHCLRVVAEEGLPENTVRVYYCTENSKSFHGSEQQFLVLDNELVPGIQCLIQNYPNYVKVADIPLDDNNVKMQLVSDLWERGLLKTEEPL